MFDYADGNTRIGFLGKRTGAKDRRARRGEVAVEHGLQVGSFHGGHDCIACGRASHYRRGLAGEIERKCSTLCPRTGEGLAIVGKLATPAASDFRNFEGEIV